MTARSPNNCVSILMIRRLAAAGARAAELEQRLQKLLLAQRASVLILRRSNSGSVEEEIPVVALRHAQRRLRPHVDGLELGLGLVFRRADVHAQRAAGAIFRRDLQREFQALEFRHARVHALECRRRAVQFRRLINLRADRRVRADRHALQALDADLLVPDRDLQREIALFVLRRAGRKRAVVRETRSPAVHRQHRRRACRARCCTNSGASGEIGGSSGPVPFNLRFGTGTSCRCASVLSTALQVHLPRLPRPFCRRFS